MFALPPVGYCFFLMIFSFPVAIGTFFPMLLPALLLLLPLLLPARCTAMLLMPLLLLFSLPSSLVDYCSDCATANIAATALAVATPPPPLLLATPWCCQHQ